MNTYDFKNRVAVVTGGAQGIGLTVVNRMLDNGAKVSIWDVNKERLENTLAEFNGNANVGMCHVDIANLASVEKGVADTIEQFGKIDILINNAAIVGPNAPTWEYDPDDFAQVVNIGLVGTFHVCRAVVPHMIEQNYGRIVNLSSVAGKEGNPQAPAYSATKAGVLALTKSLGKELAQYDIAVNAVTPAIAKTEMSMSQAPEFIEMITSKIPRQRMLELHEAAAMICWLSTEENSFTTASTFDLSGGRTTY